MWQNALFSQTLTIGCVSWCGELGGMLQYGGEYIPAPSSSSRSVFWASVQREEDIHSDRSKFMVGDEVALKTNLFHVHIKEQMSL